MQRKYGGQANIHKSNTDVELSCLITSGRGLKSAHRQLAKEEGEAKVTKVV